MLCGPACGVLCPPHVRSSKDFLLMVWGRRIAFFEWETTERWQASQSASCPSEVNYCWAENPQLVLPGSELIRLTINRYGYPARLDLLFDRPVAITTICAIFVSATLSSRIAASSTMSSDYIDGCIHCRADLQSHVTTAPSPVRL